MTPVFIFAEQVRKLVRSGKKEIEIPEGARISSAAADLIREHEIRKKTVAPGETTEANALETGNPAEFAAVDPADENVGKPSAGEDVAESAAPVEFSEEELEEIANRVIERFRKLKSGSQEKAAVAAASPAGTDAGAEDLDDDLVICRCEEITKGEIKEAIRNGIQTLNGIKRITRAGMGLCQGQTCQMLVARILTEELGLAPEAVDPTTARGPVRPIRLQVFANS
jgi:bacterioferritin-associated ferredoxin